MKLRLILRLAVLGGIFPCHLYAQTISTGPLSALSVNNPWALLLLGLVFVACAYRLLRNNRYRHTLASVLAVAVVSLSLWQSPELRAQLAASFTNPAGETLEIPVEQILDDGDIAGFQMADFTNGSGARLAIRGIVLPGMDDCFPGGLTATLLPPGQPLPDPPATCTVGMTLANGATCRVDVDTICRDLLPAVVLATVNPNAGAAAGGTGFVLTGVNLAGATSVTFGGVPATSINVVNSTTVTGVTPAHAVGVVDVVIATPAGGATLADGYTYMATAVGQPSAGGTIACLNGGQNNLIAATADNSVGIEWGGPGTTIGVAAQSNTDGASNTAAIVAELTGNQAIPLDSYGAGLCSSYEVDSQGNTPCQVGNTCYNDWFLPAGNNATATGQLNCLFTNRIAIGGFATANYWSSTELAVNNAWSQFMVSGVVFGAAKELSFRVRCVRAFTP